MNKVDVLSIEEYLWRHVVVWRLDSLVLGRDVIRYVT